MCLLRYIGRGKENLWRELHSPYSTSRPPCVTLARLLSKLRGHPLRSETGPCGALFEGWGNQMCERARQQDSTWPRSAAWAGCVVTLNCVRPLPTRRMGGGGGEGRGGLVGYTGVRNVVGGAEERLPKGKGGPWGEEATPTSSLTFYLSLSLTAARWEVQGVKSLYVRRLTRSRKLSAVGKGPRSLNLCVTCHVTWRLCLRVCVIYVDEVRA